MPLLVCPNDSTSMQSVSRSGVEFDFSSTCRGVWLDRGELEKLMEASRDSAPGPQPVQSRRRRQGMLPRHATKNPATAATMTTMTTIITVARSAASTCSTSSTEGADEAAA